MSRIESVSVCVARVPLDRVTSFATRTVTARDYCLVKVRSTQGVEGIGFCYVGSAGGRIAQIAVEELLAPKLIGQEPLRVEGLWQEMYSESLLHGRAGSVMRALSILDTAIWDLNARSAKLPLYQHLGSVTDDKVPAYASGGYYLDGKTPKKLGEEMASYVAAGFQAVKMKVGRLSPAQEEARIKAVREAIGPDVILMLDANNAWLDLPTAMRYMERYEPYQPYWIEEPFSPDEIDLHARLARSTATTVATGEIGYGRWYHKELLDKGAPHWFHDLHAHLVASTPNARYVEFFIDDQVLNFRRLIDTQLKHKDGYLSLPKTPGLGCDFDEKAVKRYALAPAKPWTVMR